MSYYAERHVSWALDAVEDELRAALDRFPCFNSPHEAKAVIEEELDELWEHVKANTGRSGAACAEAIQVAAMALRYVIDLDARHSLNLHPADSGGTYAGSAAKDGSASDRGVGDTGAET